MKLIKNIVKNDFITSTNILLLKGQEVRTIYTPDSVHEDSFIDIWRCVDGLYCGGLNPRLEVDYLEEI
jgi:hypothetical protein